VARVWNDGHRFSGHDTCHLSTSTICTKRDVRRRLSKSRRQRQLADLLRGNLGTRRCRSRIARAKRLVLSPGLSSMEPPGPGRKNRRQC
jgi:hypothetical protein